MSLYIQRLRAFYDSVRLPKDICIYIIDMLESNYRYDRLCNVHYELTNLTRVIVLADDLSILYYISGTDLCASLVKLIPTTERFTSFCKAVLSKKGMPKITFRVLDEVVHVDEYDENERERYTLRLDILRQVTAWNIFDDTLHL